MSRLLVLAFTLALATGGRAADPGLAGLLDTLARHGYEAHPDPARRAAFLAGVARGADPGAQVLLAPERAAFDAREQGSVLSCGLRLAASNSYAVVREILPGSPAAQAAVTVRSLVLSVDGTPVESNRLVSVLGRLRGPSPGRVSITLRSPEGGVRTVQLDRAAVSEPAVEWHEVLPGGVGYIRINGLHAGAGDWVVTMLRQWERERRPGVILDLRSAGGTDLDAAARIAGVVSPAGAPVFRLVSRAGALVREAVAEDGDKISMPVLALVNGSTRGAAELLAAALRHAARGTMLVGEPTAGDPMIREFLPLEGGLSLRLATRRVEFADGSRLDGSAGLAPEVRVADADLPPVSTVAQFEWEKVTGERARDPDPEALALLTRVGRDAVLQRATDILSGLKALEVRVAERLLPAPNAPKPVPTP